ncbi:MULTISPECIES: TrmB family transcriptional regulator [Halorussus]|uniref:TrmB family transcriptional regulator n=1 Tax=Halorussus TaxID=1070314 RepID=UPI00209CD3E0|nr:helix-turn-helix domain-containing protein [Halorussus vallis]USZ74380.1 TrmB family transcriptional regulator [Halorussus vallis]
MTHEKQTTVVELLQQLGLKEYEAKVFAALAQVSQATAKEISELADVPRTRVYDAGEELALRGLVEVQQSNPQRYRAIPIEEAVEVIRRQYDRRFETLSETLSDLEASGDTRRRPEGVWSLTGAEAIAERVAKLVESATEEVVVLFGSDPGDAAPILERLGAAVDRGATVYVGSLAPDEADRRRVVDAVPGARRADVLEELLSSPAADTADAADIGFLVVADRDELLLSAVGDREGDVEAAVRSTEFGNGLLAVVRRLLDGALPTEGAESEQEEEADAPASEDDTLAE